VIQICALLLILALNHAPVCAALRQMSGEPRWRRLGLTFEFHPTIGRPPCEAMSGWTTLIDLTLGQLALQG